MDLFQLLCILHLRVNTHAARRSASLRHAKTAFL